MLAKIAAVMALAAMPLAAGAAPTASFDVGSVHVDRYGSGAVTLVLIPGLTDSGAVWSTTVARYEGTYTVDVLTLPGFGGRAPIAAPMLDTVDRDIGTLLSQAQRPVVIGHSLGGYLAIRVAEEHSDLIRGAIAIDGLPVFFGMDTMTLQERAAAASDVTGRMKSFTQAQLEAGERSQLEYMTKPQNVSTALSFSKGADPVTTATYMQELMTADIRPGLSKVTVPLLEIAPFDTSIDPINPFKPLPTSAAKQTYYQTFFTGDPKARVEMVNDSRHFIMLDQPAALFALIDAFLASVG